MNRISGIGKVVLRLSPALAAVALVLLVAVRQFEVLDRKVIFFPESEITRTPSHVGLYFQDVSFAASDGTRLHGWFVPGRGDDTLLWFHGNAGNIGHRSDFLMLFNRHIDANIFIFDYRGYGRSEGKPSERGMYSDAEAALEYLRSRGDVDMDRLILFGRSLGCAVAVEMATRHPYKAVILESPFTSLEAIAKIARPKPFAFLPLHKVVMWLLQSRFDSLSKIHGVQGPLLILHGANDDIIAIDMARELFEAAVDPKVFYEIAGAGHNDTYLIGGEDYFAVLREFIENRSED